jgi:hypothetical protein
MFSLRYVVATSALVLILVGPAAGALIGSMLGAFGLQGALLAVITAVIALMVAEFGRYFTVGYLVAEQAPTSLPRVVLVNSLLSSWIGGLAGHSLSIAVFGSSSPALVGSLSGLIASILMVLLMVAFHSAQGRL